MVQLYFIKKNGQRRYKYLVLGRDRSYLVKMHSDSTKKLSETDIINMLEFLIDNIFVIFGGRVFQQIVGIPMGTICAPLLAAIQMMSLSLNNSRFGDFVDRIYPIELIVVLFIPPSKDIILV